MWKTQHKEVTWWSTVLIVDGGLIPSLQKCEPRWYEPRRLSLTPATWKFHPLNSDTQEQPENELTAASTILWQLCLASSVAFPLCESIELEDTGLNGNKRPCHAVWGWVFAKGASVLLFFSTAPSKGTPANLLILIIIILCGNNKTRLCSPCYFLWLGIFPLIKLEVLKASIERMRSVHLMYYLIGLQQIWLYSVSALNKCLFKGCSLFISHIKLHMSYCPAWGIFRPFSETLAHFWARRTFCCLSDKLMCLFFGL